ncbi:MAG: cytidylate kinase-like family protein [Oscillospiraceae bacterium]|nr:cytidylate kinase-like family protein [Oscillospiraceae bacterium]
MGSKYIITVARQFGSGGREIAEALAKELNIKFYDKELISLAAKESGMNPEVFEKIDEQATNSLLYTLSMGLYNFGNGFSAMGDLPVNDKLYIIQHKMIKRIADNGPCVILGRCADYILKDRSDVISIFINADMEYRKKHAIEHHNIDKKRAEQIISKADKTRANYYSFYSGQKWGQAKNYDLCINRGKMSHEDAVKLIKTYVNIRET